MAERLKPAIPDVEARDSTPASRIVSLHKKLYSTLSLLTQVYKFGTARHTAGWVGRGGGCRGRGGESEESNPGID